MNSRWLRGIPMSGATAAWLFYDITGAAEAPRLALSILEYSLLGCALFALVGSAVMYATERQPTAGAT